MATCSSILVWEIPWREEPGRLQSMESQRVRHILATKPPLQLFRCLYTLSCYKVFNIVPCATQQVLLFIYQSQITNLFLPTLSPLITFNLFSMFVSFYKFYKFYFIKVHLYYFLFYKCICITFFRFHIYLSFSFLLTSLSIIISRSIHIAVNDIIYFFKSVFIYDFILSLPGNFLEVPNWVLTP